jgi:hypothetical protein
MTRYRILEYLRRGISFRIFYILIIPGSFGLLHIIAEVGSEGFFQVWAGNEVMPICIEQSAPFA